MEILIPLIILIAVVVVIVATPVIILKIYTSRVEQERHRQSQLAAGPGNVIMTQGTIISVSSQPLSTSTRSVTKVDLRLQVQSPSGSTYVANTAWLVDTAILPQLQPGQLVPVKVNSQDPRMIYPNMSGAEYYIWG